MPLEALSLQLLLARAGPLLISNLSMLSRARPKARRPAAALADVALRIIIVAISHSGGPTGG
jgi:hypothetical protein